jgi:hypothetical protein
MLFGNDTKKIAECLCQFLNRTGGNKVRLEKDVSSIEQDLNDLQRMISVPCQGLIQLTFLGHCPHFDALFR